MHILFVICCLAIVHTKKYYQSVSHCSLHVLVARVSFDIILYSNQPPNYLEYNVWVSVTKCVFLVSYAYGYCYCLQSLFAVALILVAADLGRLSKLTCILAASTVPAIGMYRVVLNL